MSEITFTWARSGGPGGQHVNKTETRAVLRWNLAASPSVPDPLKARAQRRLASRITNTGDVVLSCGRNRSRERNRQECLQRLSTLLVAAFVVPKRRKPTRPSRGAVERRIGKKKRRGDQKKQRQNRWD
ncbi:MAG: ribosome-associated protein [Myxococcota bacterium]|jgi:ribosome-associated protein